MKRILFFFISLMAAISALAQNYPYQDPSLSPEERANDLLGRLSVEQKIMLMDYDSPEIAEFGIRKYNWWNEALHGSARNGLATVFPQSIGMAAMIRSSSRFSTSLRPNRESSSALPAKVRAYNVITDSLYGLLISISSVTLAGEGDRRLMARILILLQSWDAL